MQQAPEPAGVHRAGGELPGGLNHHLHHRQQGESGPLISQSLLMQPSHWSFTSNVALSLAARLDSNEDCVAGPAQENVWRKPGGSNKNNLTG